MPITITDGVVVGTIVSGIVGSYGWTYKRSRDLEESQKEDRNNYQVTCREIFGELKEIQGKLNRLMGKFDMENKKGDE